MFSIYHEETGMFLSKRFGYRKHAEHNCPPGHKVIEGWFDPLSQRVDVQSGEVVDYQPPKPDDDHEWRENVARGRARWVKKADVAERERKDMAARIALIEIDTRSIRAIREALMKDDQRLAELEAQAVEARKDLA